MPAWAAVVVNYEAGPLLTDCVASVLADTSAGPVELVVVDNGSRDGSVAELQRAHPDVRVVRAPGNVGYARAANLGIAATRADIVAVLNPDTRLERGVAGALVDRVRAQGRLAAVGPRLKNLDGTDYPSARSIPSTSVAVDARCARTVLADEPVHDAVPPTRRRPDAARLVDWVSGAAVWLRRDALDDVGGWDERYFMYLEDVDLCWRLRRAHWEIAYEPAGVVWHVQGASTARRPYRMLAEHHRSAWRFARRRYTGARAVLLPFAAVYLAARGALAMAAHRWDAHRNATGTG